MQWNVYMVSNKIDEFVNNIFETYKDVEWNDAINNAMMAESIKLARLSTLTYAEIFDTIKSRYNKKVNIYKLSKPTPKTPKKKKSIFWFFNRK